MKKLSHLLLMIAAAAFILTSCEGPAGPEGPQGPAGPKGDTGAQGIQGPAGESGTAGCIVCHDDSQTIVAKSAQWAVSTHATGGNFERNSADCAVCHTSQGFVAKIAGETAADISDPASINCYTCHNIHETFTAADLALRTNAAVTLMATGDVVDKGDNNLCINCHQTRDSYTIPDPNADPATTYDVSTYWGPHHGPQGSLLAGVSAVEFTGSLTINSGANAKHGSAGCITCHMADPYGVQAGGHTWGMTYVYHGAEAVWLAGCANCHGDLTDAEMHTKIEDSQAVIEGLLTNIATELTRLGALPAGNHTLPELTAGVLWNYNLFEDDRSLGVHNPSYAKAVLTNTYEKALTLPTPTK